MSFVDCIFRGVRSTEVVEASGSILFRNVKIEPGREGPKFELAADVAVGIGYSQGLQKSDWPLIENRRIESLTPVFIL